MASGLLTGKMTRERIENVPSDDWRHNAENFQEPKLSRNLDLVEKLREIGARHDASPAEVAIAWTLGHPASRRGTKYDEGSRPTGRSRAT
jgi:aryl-alcohol dehydrogenase-like predicted oxidoreductase